MIDWHSHILPEMDDGSRSVAESIAIINVQASQGVKTIIATPHFYADDETVESFLNRREKAFACLSSKLPQNSPEIRLGAEARYYQGISRMKNLHSLKIEGTKLLLLEMPVARWTESVVRELLELSGKGNLKIVLAHVERYMRFQSSGVLERLIESGIMMQVNASFFTTFTSKRKALFLLQKGNIHMVGSDCHNMTSRSPKIGKAFETIRRKLGDDYIDQMNEYGKSMLVQINN